MPVDADTEDTFGHRKPGTPARDELIVRVYADLVPSDFTLYEDDGLTVRYDDTGRPSYNHRTTRLTQSMSGAATAMVRVDSAVDIDAGGPYNGAPAGRSNVIELVVEEAKATGVSMKCIALTL
jgi:hypothetical protein